MAIKLFGQAREFVARKLFNAYLKDQFPTYSTDKNKVAAAERIVNRLANYIIGLSNFEAMKEEEVYEELFTWEPEIGGAVDRMSSLVRQSFGDFYINDVDNPYDSNLEPGMAEKYKKMLYNARKIAEGIRYKDLIELYADLLMTQGNVFIDIRPPAGKKVAMTYKIVPNKLATLVDRHTQVANNDLQLITEGNILVMKEMMSDQQVMGPGEFIHLKYKDTPVFTRDFRGRITYGVYSISPIHRTILSVWQKRQTNITDILHRWKILPREIHYVNGDQFDINQYPGTPQQKMAAAREDAASFLADYNSQLKSQGPDEGYIVLDSVKVEILESTSAPYMHTNELLTQLENKCWTALNIPESVVNGSSKGSYASELVTSNYVSGKAEQIAEKIKPVILKQIRDRLLMIDGTFPVHSLDMKIELDMATTQLEKFRTAAIMATLNCFTRTEIRSVLGYGPVDPHDEANIINIKGGAGDQGLGGTDEKAPGSAVKANPDTTHSSQDHMSDSAGSFINSIENKG